MRAEAEAATSGRSPYVAIKREALYALLDDAEELARLSADEPLAYALKVTRERINVVGRAGGIDSLVLDALYSILMTLEMLASSNKGPT